MNVLLVDANMVYAASKAKLGHLSRKDGYPTGAVFGFVRMVEAEVKKHEIERVYVCQEAGGTSRKREILPQYKSGREDSTAAVKEAGHAELIHEWAMLRGCLVAWCDGYEADDTIATLSAMHSDDGDTVVILSRDHDFLALLDDRTTVVWSNRTKDRAWFVDEYGFDPRYYPMFLALAGDPTDTVPRLLAPALVRDNIVKLGEDGKVEWDVDAESLVRNLRLVVMGTEDNEVELNSSKFDPIGLGAFYERLEFKSLLKNVMDLRELC